MSCLHTPECASVILRAVTKAYKLFKLLWQNDGGIFLLLLLIAIVTFNLFFWGVALFYLVVVAWQCRAGLSSDD